MGNVKPSRAETRTPKKRAVKIAANPVGDRANMDAYDELLLAAETTARTKARPAAKRAPKADAADIARSKRASTSPVRTSAKRAPKADASVAARSRSAKRTSNIDAYDELLFAGSARGGAKRNPGTPTRSSAKRSQKTDGYDELLLAASSTHSRKKAEASDELFLQGAKRTPAARRAPRGEKAAVDEFDRYIARIEGGQAKKSTPARHAKGSRTGGGGPGSPVTWTLTALILMCVLFAGARLVGYANFIKMRNAVARSTYFDGTSVEGVDVSGMTLADAVTYWDENIERGYSGRTVSFDDGTSVTTAQMGYKSNYREVLEGIWSEQRSGTLKERYRNLRARSGEPRNYPVSRALYDEAVLQQYVDYVASSIDAAGADAAVTGFDLSTLSFSFREAQTGYKLNREKLKADIASAFQAGGGTVARDITTTPPGTRIADIKDEYGLIASAITNASSSSKNRLTNIQLACNAINGFALEPGAEFSFNEVVGRRTAERGYKVANAFSGGEVIEEIGGGICQVSTTLFNAAVKSGLQVTERHPHSMPVAYVDKGKDAAVNWGSQDLKIVNNTGSTVYIVAVVTSDKRVKIGVFGKTLPNGTYITIEANVTETYDYKTTYKTNAFLQPGTTNVLQSGRTGYKAVAYKMTWSKDGSLISKDLLYTSVYNKRDAIIEVPQ